MCPRGAILPAESQFTKCEMGEGLSQHPICHSWARCLIVGARGLELKQHEWTSRPYVPPLRSLSPSLRQSPC